MIKMVSKKVALSVASDPEGVIIWSKDALQMPKWSDGWANVGNTKRGARIEAKKMGAVVRYRLSGYSADGYDIDESQ